MALVGRLIDEVSLTTYLSKIEAINRWLHANCLVLNVRKTKELVMGDSNLTNSYTPVQIDQETVEIVDNFKYLGTIMDSKFLFEEHSNMVYNRAQQRLHLLRKLNSFGVSKSVMQLVYRSIIESVLSYNISTWYGNLQVTKGRTKLAGVVNEASKLIGREQRQLSTLFDSSVRRNAFKIFNDPSHPLNRKFELLPSGRRLKTIMARKNIYKKSFTPSAVSVLNASMK